MSLSPTDIADLVLRNPSVLCIDTCSVLDVIRDITRETVTLNDANAGLALLSAAESHAGLVVLIAEQVDRELADNLDGVAQDAINALTRFQQQVLRIHDIAMAYGASGAMEASHLGGHVDRAKAVVERWKNVAWRISSNDGIASRALRRVNEPRTPARKGKESMKDCVVIETYLEAAGQLRAVGHSAPIVFMSSNTKEYFAPSTRHLQSDIAADLGAVAVEYAPNFGAARHLLGVQPGNSA